VVPKDHRSGIHLPLHNLYRAIYLDGLAGRGVNQNLCTLPVLYRERVFTDSLFWRLAIRAIKWAWQISLDFCSRMLYPTLDGS
jgi:hypothetical protein